MKSIEVPALARVEGEGGLYIGLQDGKAVEIRLDIYEPPRFFEGSLVDRFLQEVPDITARICGICPVAYQMSSVTALENALGLKVTSQVRDLRRLMYCGEHIESHALHIYLLQAPDLLGKESAFELAAIAPEVVKTALRLKKIGNEILKAIGGRSVHPVNVCVGGFYRWPDLASLKALLPDLEWGLQAAKETVAWAATLPYPDLNMDYEYVALHRPDEYAVVDGEVWSSSGRKLSISEYENGYLEQHVRRSNALHSHTVDGNTYLVGPLARLNLNHEQLLPAAHAARYANPEFIQVHPTAIPGVSLGNFLRLATNSVRAGHNGNGGKKPLSVSEFQKLLREKMDILKMDRSFASRYVNDGSWHTVSIPISAFTTASPAADLTHVNTAFLLFDSASPDTADIYLDNIHWTKN